MEKEINHTTEEINEAIKNGTAKYVHLYDVTDIFRPRGSMKKESLGEYLLERLHTYYKSWTDEKYSDLPGESILINILRNNLKEESEAAFTKFLTQLTSKNII